MAFTPFVGSDDFSMANFNKAFNQLNDSKVDFTEAQSLTANQMVQARGNINAAPGGFGLGGPVAIIPANANLNDYIRTGFFGNGNTSVISTWINTPANWPANEAILEAYVLEKYAIQRLSSVTTKVSAQRSLLNNVWAEWEWINPPLQLGVEYRTTERYLGKPVYVKMIDCGNLPNAGLKTVSIGTSGLEKVIDISGCAVDASNGDFYSIPATNFDVSTPNIGLYVTGPQSIVISTQSDRSSYSAYVKVKYTKTTE